MEEAVYTCLFLQLSAVQGCWETEIQYQSRIHAVSADIALYEDAQLGSSDLITVWGWGGREGSAWMVIQRLDPNLQDLLKC